ncbi:AMP-binding protein, partial [Streptomyces sp. NPDC048606]|uniref:AMP-binding protein n=1 Tax=Streptomyces sp. NPDC048606 TaxID=3154726 RepID=UPI003432AD23
GAPHCVIARFEQTALRHPSLPAVEQHAEVTDYARLRHRMREISNGLDRLGVRPGDRVSVRGRASAELVAAVLGVLHAGAVLLLLDEALPPARAEAFTEQVAPRVRLAASTAPPGPGEVPVGDLTAAPEHPPHQPSAAHHDEAYVFFTSGSTGAPKGILGGHRGLAHFVDWEISALGVGPGDRVAQLTSPSFDVVLRDLFLPLCSGATVVLPDVPGNLHGRSVLPWLARTRVTVLHTVPSLVRGWLRTGGLADPLALRATCFAGEPLDARLAEQWRSAAAPAGEIWNFYGPTETTLAKLAHRVTGAEEPGVLPVGRPLPGCEVTLVDADGTPVPDGEAGEAVLRAPFRSHGYLDGAGRPTGGFRQVPGGRPGEWLYHTGDLASRTADGRYVVRGRIDDQVKIRGLRVEPAEVAAHVRAAVAPHGAGDAFVTAVAREGTPEKQLVAFVDGDLPPAALTAAVAVLREQLPLAMVPSVIHSVPVLPLTANGKVDRARLRELGRQAAAEHHGPLSSGPPDSALDGNPVLDAVRAAMATALGRASVTPDCDFFALGGDSLAVAELLAVLSDELGVKDLGHTDVLRAPTPAALAARAGASATTADGARLDFGSIPHEPVLGKSYPLSPQQRRFAAFYLAGPPRNWSNVQLRLPLPDAICERDLHAALRLLVARHPGLRTRFTTTAGTTLQQVLAPADVPLPLPVSDVEPEVLAAELIAVPVPLSTGFPWSAVLARGIGTSELIMTLNHMITDGSSQGLLRTDLRAILAHLSDGEELPPAPAGPAYVEYARHQNSAEEANAARLRDFWRGELAGLTPTTLPRHPGTWPKDARGAYAALRLTHSPVTAAGALSCTPFALLLAAFTQELADHLQRDDLAVHIPSTGRPHPAVLRVVGNFHNIVPVRLTRTATLAATARATQAALARSLDHQGLQLDTLVADLGMDPAAEPYPLSSILFNAVPGRSPLLPDSADHAAGALPYDVRYDLMGVVRGQDDAWVLELHYRASLLDSKTAQRLLNSMAGLLAGAGPLRTRP